MTAVGCTCLNYVSWFLDYYILLQHYVKM